MQDFERAWFSLECFALVEIGVLEAGVVNVFDCGLTELTDDLYGGLKLDFCAA